MIRHIFKIIWNERKINAWLILEYIIVFCVLWFCCDYLYSMLNSYYSYQGYDIEHVYRIGMQEDKSITNNPEATEIDRYGIAMTLMDRVKRHPDIENISLSTTGMPYGDSRWMGGYKINSDSLNHTLLQRYVSSGFFDVFKINVEGNIFDWTDNSEKDNVIISPFGGNHFGDIQNKNIIDIFSPFGSFGGTQKRDNCYPISEVNTLRYDTEWDERKSNYKVIGRTGKIRERYFDPPQSSVIIPLTREDVNISRNELAVRVKAEADDKDFIERFSKEMRDQLSVSPYSLSYISSIEELKTRQSADTRDKMNSAYAITLFLAINVFLGILGSFWFRTQSRRSEIGLRIALGSSQKKVQLMVVFETLLLLFISSIVASIICLNLSNPTIIRSLGIPAVHKESWGIGYEQNIINFAITFGFLAFVSVIAVWYPAKQASKTQPAEALHDE